MMHSTINSPPVNGNDPSALLKDVITEILTEANRPMSIPETSLLRIKAFYGTSPNAVKTKIWIAIVVAFPDTGISCLKWGICY